MNIINYIKIKTQYSDLRGLNIDNTLLENVIKDKSFAQFYKSEIIPFLKYLQNYVGYSYDRDNDSTIKKKLDDETISCHINNIIKLYKDNNSIKYISFVKDNALEEYKLNNTNIMNDQNFDSLFNMIRIDIFNDNVSKIINDGHSERLLQFTKKHAVNISDLSPTLFNDNVWTIINSNPTIGNTSTVDLFIKKLNILIDIIEQGYFEGLKYTYENIPESKDFILSLRESYSLKQFDINFINTIGNDVLGKLYYRNCFTEEAEFSKIFKIYECGNYELIHDIVNYDPTNFCFSKILEEDFTKELIDTSIGYYNKNEVLLNKYFGIEQYDNKYIKLFLSSINKTKLTDEFKEKYGFILNMLNQIYNATEQEIIDIKNKLTTDKKEEYHKLVYDCEEAGNELIKDQFKEDLVKRNTQLLSEAKHTSLPINNEANVDVYELTGQPFTMLVHAVTDNKMSENNSFVSEIVNNPAAWNEITEGNDHISTSLISNHYMVAYGIPNNENTVMFGFHNIPSQAIKFTSVNDAGISRNGKNINYNMRNRTFLPDINTVASVDELMQKTILSNTNKEGMPTYNEIGISRINENTGDKIQPDYIVCMDRISENSKKAAEYFGVPIYLINRSYYNDLSNLFGEKGMSEQEQNDTEMHR